MKLVARTSPFEVRGSKASSSLTMLAVGGSPDKSRVIAARELGGQHKSIQPNVKYGRDGRRDKRRHAIFNELREEMHLQDSGRKSKGFRLSVWRLADGDACLH